MATCQTCGNDYDKTFQVVQAGRTHEFDSFECAIEALAPRCGNCKTRIIGHGVEVGPVVFCCANCANTAAGKATGVQDRV